MKKIASFQFFSYGFCNRTKHACIVSWAWQGEKMAWVQLGFKLYTYLLLLHFYILKGQLAIELTVHILVVISFLYLKGTASNLVHCTHT